MAITKKKNTKLISLPNNRVSTINPIAKDTDVSASQPTSTTTTTNNTVANNYMNALANAGNTTTPSTSAMNSAKVNQSGKLSTNLATNQNTRTPISAIPTQTTTTKSNDYTKVLGTDTDTTTNTTTNNSSVTLPSKATNTTNTTTSTTTPSSTVADTTTETKSTPTWEDYSSLIASKTANSKSELESALQRANAYSQNYLRALGLQGSGAGMSAISDVNTNYMNALANVNANAEESVNNQLAEDYTNLVESGADAETLEAFRERYGKETGLDTSWQAEEQAYNNSLANADTNERNENTFASMLENTNYTLEDYENWINSNIDEEDRDMYLEAAKSALSNRETSDTTDNWANDKETISAIANNIYGSVDDAEATLNSIGETYGTDSYQYKQAQALLESAGKTWNTSEDYATQVEALSNIASGAVDETEGLYDYSNLPQATKDKAREVLEELENAGSQAEVERIIEENATLLNDTANYLVDSSTYTSDNSKWVAESGQIDFVKQYSTKNVSADTATVTSFGKFADSGTNKGSQDKYLQAIITAANNGRIPEGTIIDVNYGRGKTLYCYSNGTFYKVSSNTTLKGRSYIGAKDSDKLKELGITW